LFGRLLVLLNRLEDPNLEVAKVTSADSLSQGNEVKTFAHKNKEMRELFWEDPPSLPDLFRNDPPRTLLKKTTVSYSADGASETKINGSETRAKAPKEYFMMKKLAHGSCDKTSKRSSNVISLGQATISGCDIHIRGDFLTMRNSCGNLLIKVPRSANRLYKAQLKVEKPYCLQANIDEESWLWHVRLGHIGFGAVNLMHKLAKGVPVIRHQDQVCESCIVGKQTKKSFSKKATYKASRILEMFHGDICGPITPSTQVGRNRWYILAKNLVQEVFGKYYMHSCSNISHAYNINYFFPWKWKENTNQRGSELGTFYVQWDERMVAADLQTPATVTDEDSSEDEYESDVTSIAVRRSTRNKVLPT
nr:zinc finger, CCHC-type [Tanacetum cinerariifolium]